MSFIQITTDLSLNFIFLSHNLQCSNYLSRIAANHSKISEFNRLPSYYFLFNHLTYQTMRIATYLISNSHPLLKTKALLSNPANSK